VHSKIEGKYKLCYQKFGESVVDTGFEVALSSATSSHAVSSIDVDTAVLGVPTTIKLTMTGSNTLGQATFIPQTSPCKSAQPDVAISADGKGIFKITGNAGQYKLCYQKPESTDSVEQVSEKNSEGITIKVIASRKTTPGLLKSVYPDVVTVNTRTMLYLKGAKEGYKASFVNRETGNCSDIEAVTDIGAGHALFTITSSGNFTACLRIPGAIESVGQVNVNILVRPPGVMKVQADRWERERAKKGTVDCSGKRLVAHCLASHEPECNKTFVISSGIAYPCFYSATPWPGVCTTNTSTTKEAAICNKDTCGGGDPPLCW